MPVGSAALDGPTAGRRPAPPAPRSKRFGTEVTSYASRLMLSRWRGEMLSDVMLPPYPPQPSVIAGSRPVDSPIEPNVVGELTTMRKAGFLRPNSRIT